MPELNAALLREIGAGIALPALAALAIAWISGRIWRSGLAHSYLPANLGFAGGFSVGLACLPFTVWLPQERGHEWLPALALAAGLLAAVARLSEIEYLRWSPVAFVPLLVGWMAVPLYPRLLPEIWWWRAALAGAVFGTWISLQRTSEEIGGARLTATLTLFCAAAGGFLFQFAASGKFAQLGLLTAAGFAGVWLAEVIDRKGSLLPGLTPVFAVLYPGWLIDGMLHSHSGTPKYCYGLMVAAPLALNLGRLPPLRRRGWLGFGLSAAVALAAATAAITFAWRALPANDW